MQTMLGALQCGYIDVIEAAGEHADCNEKDLKERLALASLVFRRTYDTQGFPTLAARRKLYSVTARCCSKSFTQLLQ